MSYWNFKINPPTIASNMTFILGYFSLSHQPLCYPNLGIILNPILSPPTLSHTILWVLLGKYPLFQFHGHCKFIEHLLCHRLWDTEVDIWLTVQHRRPILSRYSLIIDTEKYNILLCIIELWILIRRVSESLSGEVILKQKSKRWEGAKLLKRRKKFQKEKNIICSGSESRKEMASVGKTENFIELIEYLFCVSFTELP